MIVKTTYYKYICDDCGYTENLVNLPSGKNKVLSWVISRDRQACYCKNCAPFHRYVGRNGATMRREDKYLF